MKNLLFAATAVNCHSLLINDVELVDQALGVHSIDHHHVHQAHHHPPHPPHDVYHHHCGTPPHHPHHHPHHHHNIYQNPSAIRKLHEEYSNCVESVNAYLTLDQFSEKDETWMSQMEHFETPTSQMTSEMSQNESDTNDLGRRLEAIMDNEAINLLVGQATRPNFEGKVIDPLPFCFEVYTPIFICSGTEKLIGETCVRELDPELHCEGGDLMVAQNNPSPPSLADVSAGDVAEIVEKAGAQKRELFSLSKTSMVASAARYGKRLMGHSSTSSTTTTAPDTTEAESVVETTEAALETIDTEVRGLKTPELHPLTIDEVQKLVPGVGDGVSVGSLNVDVSDTGNYVCLQINYSKPISTCRGLTVSVESQAQAIKEVAATANDTGIANASSTPTPSPFTVELEPLFNSDRTQIIGCKPEVTECEVVPRCLIDADGTFYHIELLNANDWSKNFGNKIPFTNGFACVTQAGGPRSYKLPSWECPANGTLTVGKNGVATCLRCFQDILYDPLLACPANDVLLCDEDAGNFGRTGQAVQAAADGATSPSSSSNASNTTIVSVPSNSAQSMETCNCIKYSAYAPTYSCVQKDCKSVRPAKALCADGFLDKNFNRCVVVREQKDCVKYYAPKK